MSAGTSNKHAGGWTQALARAAEAGDARLVGELLAAGAPADVRFEGGATPLMRAAARGFADVARVLLDAGADPNARRGDGFTPLVLAVFFGHEAVVRLLLERGADPAARTRLGVGVRDWAAARGFDAIGELLSHSAATSAAPATNTPRLPVTITVARQGVEPPPAERVRDTGAGRVKEGTPERGESHPYEPHFYPPPRGSSWSWPAAAGVFMLVAAGGLGAFAIWQRSRGPANVGHTPVAPATQAAQPLPTPPAQPAPTATPGAPTPDMPGAIIIPPGPAVQPAPLPPDFYGPAATSVVPSVVSESGPTFAEPTPRRDAREARGEAATTATPPAGRDDEEARPADPPRRERSPELEAQAPSRPPDPQPAPSATPRRRVIQWPP